MLSSSTGGTEPQSSPGTGAENTMTTTKRDQMVADFAAQYVRYDAQGDVVLRAQADRDGLEVAGSGRSLDGARRAWKRAVAAAAKS